jgi:hypothetical protein
MSREADQWVRQFLEGVEDKLLRSRTVDSGGEPLNMAAARAVVDALEETGTDLETVLALFGRVAVEKRHGSQNWSEDLNARRCELIDKDVDGTLELGERMELAGLTRLLRERFDTETSVPLTRLEALLTHLDSRREGGSAP